MKIRLSRPRGSNQWILALAGVAVTAGCLVPLVRGALSLSWPKVDGVITRSAYMPGYRATGVEIGYRYTAGGQEYTGNRFRFQFVLSARKMLGRDVQSSLGRYPVGEQVKISVNPANPGDSVLEAGPDFNSVIPLVVGLAMLLLGFGDVRKQEQAVGVPVLPVTARPRYGLARVLALGGFGLLLVGGFYLYRGMRSTQWPSVEGRILYSHARGARHPETLLWYEYYVNNQRYLASSYRNGGNVTPFLSVAEEAAKRYPVGRVVAVYYDPESPTVALLEPGIWWGNLMAPLFALLLFGAAWIAKKYAEIMASRRR